MAGRQVAVANNGNIFVADGYCNARVVEFTPEGSYLGEFSLPMQAGGPMRVPHSLVRRSGNLCILGRNRNIVEHVMTAVSNLFFSHSWWCCKSCHAVLRRFPSLNFKASVLTDTANPCLCLLRSWHRSRSVCATTLVLIDG